MQKLRRYLRGKALVVAQIEEYKRNALHAASIILTRWWKVDTQLH